MAAILTTTFRECLEIGNVPAFTGCLNEWGDSYREFLGAPLRLLKTTWSLPAFLLGVAFIFGCFAISNDAPRVLARINLETIGRIRSQLDDIKAWGVLTTICAGLAGGGIAFFTGSKFDVSLLVAIISSLFTMILYMSYFTVPSIERGSRSVQLALEAREAWRTLPNRFWNFHKDLWNNFGTAGHCLGVSKSSQMYLTKILPEHLGMSQHSFLALHDLKKFPPDWFFNENGDHGDPFTSAEKLRWLTQVRDKEVRLGYTKTRIMMGPRSEFLEFIKLGLTSAGKLRSGSNPQLFLDAMLGSGLDVFHFEKEELENFLTTRAELDPFEAKSVVAADFALFDKKVLIEHDGGHILSVAVGQQAAWYIEFLRAIEGLRDSGDLIEGLRKFGGERLTLKGLGDESWKYLVESSEAAA